MKDENGQGSRFDMQALEAGGRTALAEQLIDTAAITGLPDRAFFKSFTARRRREIVYNVHAASDRFSLRLEVHGSGKMRVFVRMACVSIEDGVVDEHDDENLLSWAHNGEEVVLHTRLDHRHLQQFPCPRDVMGAFLEAIGTQITVACPGGVQQWRMVMQLFADRVARDKGVPVEIEAMLPLPPTRTGAPCRGPSEITISDLTDQDEPTRIPGYEAEIAEMDEDMTPEAMVLMLLPPGYLVCQRHREIFTAG